MNKLFRQVTIYVLIFVGAAVLTGAVAALLVNISDRKEEEAQYPLKVVEIAEDELDPAYGAKFPQEYDRFVKTGRRLRQDRYGVEPYSKLEKYWRWCGGRIRLQQGSQRGTRPLLRPDRPGKHRARQDRGAARRVYQLPRGRGAPTDRGIRLGGIQPHAL
jgi:hypothetical protein